MKRRWTITTGSGVVVARFARHEDAWHCINSDAYLCRVQEQLKEENPDEWIDEFQLSSHLSVTQAMAPVSFTGSPAFVAPLAMMKDAAGRAAISFLKFIAISLYMPRH